jgi:CheY-like chemotaxis protein
MAPRLLNEPEGLKNAGSFCTHIGQYKQAINTPPLGSVCQKRPVAWNRPMSKKKVLIAEDYADIRTMTRIMVEAIGFEVVEAADGFEAVEKAKQHHPDVVLMDIAMPILNGITAASLIHKLEDCSNIPIVAVTAYGRDYVESAADYGFDAVIEKPVDIDNLKDVLEAQLKARPRRALQPSL